MEAKTEKKIYPGSSQKGGCTGSKAGVVGLLPGMSRMRKPGGKGNWRESMELLPGVRAEAEGY